MKANVLRGEQFGKGGERGKREGRESYKFKLKSNFLR